MSSRREIRRRRRLAAVGVLALVGFLSGFTLALKRRDFAEQWLLMRMREAGLQAPSLQVRTMDWGVLEVRGLRAGGDLLEVGRVEARFGARDLLTGRLRELRIGGVVVRGAPDAVESLLPATRSVLAAASGEVIFDALVLESARLRLETSWGEVEVLGSGRLARTGETGFEGEARVEATGGLLRARAALSGTATPYGLSGDLVLEAAASGAFGAGRLDAASLLAEAELRGRPDAWELAFRKCADLRIDGLVFEHVGALASPLRACLGKPEQRLLAVVPSEAGAARLEGSLEIAPVPLELELGAGATRAEGESPRLTWTLSGSLRQPTLTLVSRGGLLAVPEPGFELHGLEGALEWGGGSGLEGRARVAEILDVSDPPRLPRLGLAFEARREASGTSFALRLSDDTRLFALELDGRSSAGSEPLRAELRLEPVPVGSGGVEVLRLLPGLADAEASGTIAALGSFEWGEGGLSGGIDVALRDLDLSSPRAEVELANGVVRIEGPSPLVAPPGQLLSVARLDLGLELLDGLVRFAVGPEGAVSIEESAWIFAGGDAVARGSLDPEAETPLVLTVEDADPSELFALLDLAGLGGAGSLSGTLTLARAESGLVIESGRLTSNGEGLLRYRPGPEDPDEVVEALAPRAEALANFRYRELEVELAGPVQGTVDVQVTLMGANPDLGEASPVELRFEVPGALEPRTEITVPQAVVPPEVAEALAAFEARASAR